METSKNGFPALPVASLNVPNVWHFLSVFDYFQELVLDEDGKKVTERTCYPGNNNHGMVAWKIDLKTPEYPKGREIVVIANDISHQIGLSYM